MKCFTLFKPPLIAFFLTTASSLLLSCTGDPESPYQPEKDEELSGGTNFTTYDLSINAFGEQGRNLTSKEEGQFVTGNSFFRNNWVIAPASVESLDGLGPMVNAISCGSCHFKDGRAAPPSFETEPLKGLLFRLSVPGQEEHGKLAGDPHYGSQFQDKSIPGVENEGKVRVRYVEIQGQYADGQPFTLRQPEYEFYELNYGPFASDIQFSPRIAQQIPGLGLLENVPREDILSYVDENDQDGDGISGKANYVYDIEQDDYVLGRFGWKANQPSIRQQVSNAFHEDIGITTTLFPEQNLTPVQQDLYGDLPSGGEPELDDVTLEKIANYVRTLAVPIRRDWEKQEVLKGKAIFAQLECAGCHRPELRTGFQDPITALNNQLIRPYSDLLLHDMGDGLADGRPDGEATGREWRTPPLWGLGMIQTVNGHTFLLHDGRARNMEEAILWHGGEAQTAKDAFTKLSASERQNLLTFLKSL